VCDVAWNVDGPGTLAIHLWYRKNDQKKQGLHPRMAQGSLKEGSCPLALLSEYWVRGRVCVSPWCTKRIWPCSPCEACGRLFRNTTAGGERLDEARANWQLSKSVVRKAVKESLARIGVDPGNYTPISMRKGGISAAVEGNVDQTLWQLQSGHRSTAWQNYADVRKRRQLYDFPRAFGL